jgi:phosphoribosylaminoimidazolecarboxamide formyltransferase / IMP cyclohydrolase
VQAYVRARDADPKSSFGDFAALSEPVDAETATFLQGVVSDGIVAPGYEPGVAGMLAAKKGGRYVVLEADPGFEPPPREVREVFGMRLEQDADHAPMSPVQLEQVVCGTLPEGTAEDLLLGLVAVKYTQSNAVGYALGGQTIGIGAGQQSRVDCTKLAGAKADLWYLRRHPKVMALPFREDVKRQDRINWCVRYIEGDLTPHEQDALAAALDGPLEPLTGEERQEWLAALDGVSFLSDGFIPFRDNIDHARRHGVRFVAEPGGSIRGEEIEQACREHGITLVRTGLRLFHH